MKVLAIADSVHNPFKISQLLDEKPDLIVTLGDLDLDDLRALKESPIPKVGIYGNHCVSGYLDYLKIINLHLKTTKINSLLIGGFEGCVKYKNSSFQYTQEQALGLLESFPKVDIFLSHAPPQGINDNPDEDSHQGFEVFRNYIELHSPRFWLHGHSYPTKGQKFSRFNDTIVIYVNDVEMIDLSLINKEILPLSKSYL